MTALPVYRPPNPPARRGGILLLVLGGLAAVIGLAFIAGGMNVAALAETPGGREQLDEIRKQFNVDPKILFIAYGVLLLCYASAAITLGVLLRRAGRAVIIATLVLTALTATLAALSTVTTLFGGPPAAALLPLIVVVAHGLLVRWMVEALDTAPAAARPVATNGLPLPTRRPMQDYYTPPLPPPPGAA